MKKLFALIMALLMAVSLMCSASALSCKDAQKKVDEALYAEIIESLDPGQGYAFIPVTDNGIDALLVPGTLTKQKDGTVTGNGRGYLYCIDRLGRVQWVSRLYTDTPYATGNGRFLYTTFMTDNKNIDWVEKNHVIVGVGEYNKLLIESARVDPLTEGTIRYSYHSVCDESLLGADDKDGKQLKRMIKEYKAATPVNFTIVK